MQRWAYLFLLELMQWVFQTGVSDVDDLILNTLGACAGFLLWQLSGRIKRNIRKACGFHDKTE